ncbi:MAG: molecular chaperone SurA [Candidatus Dactylopiibacterium carminicum]|uniref:Chaperone SurA n=1 Tax=Candidatus Dactylopiibacterium carminicum TaxID=857335 RepID=A0A272EZ73_9RHOO|nr:peptidylprolyl isomerase [Candidatus Dactylopiibacterium carminicum]KAF7600907.1 molecular chaperone SurA [Candidatus Dactylopiibacterium carminicum]PAS95422.1 MAG: molecular chaperone SurA [Candidatus Dactylopiibacterium carminicum]PAS98719.1 MAG: molecular chaperone SurA [Candidatus Dactylopiibacterium carminicum]PAT00912.1 MAG: molecular chaperone SurA [Candidatus Dactylopiibacterium carminicum]
MKRLLQIICAIGLTLPVFGQAAELDRVAAVVNSDVLTASDLSSRLAQAERQLSAQGTKVPPAQLRSQVLEHMVLERIQLQKAKELGIKVDDSTLDRALARIAEQNQTTVAELPRLVASEGLAWAQFRESIRTEILLARLREREVDARITVSDAELEATLAAQPQLSGREYRVAHILLRAPEGASPEQLLALGQRAEELQRRIRAGEDFAALAAAYSASPDAMNGGLLDWRPLERLPSIFAERLPQMQKGDVSNILRSAAGLHVFKFVDVRDLAPSKIEITQTHARHILIRTTDVRDPAEGRRRLADIANRIRNGVDFAEMARVHSSDATAAKGGDLGWLSPGETVPEFERAMDALKPGEVSDVVESPFGWHVIQVLERKQVDVTQDRRKLEARNALRERKADEAFDDWLRQLRDSAYVEIKPE